MLWLRPKEVARRTDRAVCTVARWIRAGHVAAKRLPGGRVLVLCDHDGHPLSPRRDAVGELTEALALLKG